MVMLVSIAEVSIAIMVDVVIKNSIKKEQVY